MKNCIKALRAERGWSQEAALRKLIATEAHQFVQFALNRRAAA